MPILNNFSSLDCKFPYRVSLPVALFFLYSLDIFPENMDRSCLSHLRYPALFALGFIGGCFVVASSFPVPSEYLAGTLRVQTYYQGTPKVPVRYPESPGNIEEKRKKQDIILYFC